MKQSIFVYHLLICFLLSSICWLFLEKVRKKNCGFVSFMHRSDAEEALRELGGKYRLNFSKAVHLPNVPLVRKTRPEDAKQGKLNYSSRGNTGMQEQQVTEEIFELPADAVKYEIKIPEDRRMKKLIDRVATYIAKQGHIFEKLIMERESQNDRYKFMFLPTMPEHMYYRWKVYSLSQGKQTKRCHRVQLVCSNLP